jgi:uncharacterized protein YjbI with pentapeptide repeats
MCSATETGQSDVEENSLKALSDNIKQLSEISQNSRTTFFMLILACAYSYLTIAATTDAALLSNSSATPLPIIPVNVSIKWFYYFAPIILSALFVYFHLYLDRFWRCLVLLPLRHPDGRGLDNYVYPWLISSAFIRGEIPPLSKYRISIRVEAFLSLLFGWWIIPVVLLFCWARYLVAHDWVGTLLHLMLFMATSGFALSVYYSAKNALRWMVDRKEQHGESVKLVPEKAIRHTRKQLTSILGWSLLLGGIMLFLSAGAIEGVPADQTGDDIVYSFYRYGNNVLATFGIEPYIKVEKHRFVTKLEKWEELLNDKEAMRSYLDRHSGLVLSNRDLRRMNGQNAFLPASRISGGTFDFARLQHIVLTGSELENVRLRGTKLTGADLQYAKIKNTQFEDVIADVINLKHAQFFSSSVSGDFSVASFENVTGDNITFKGRGLYGAQFIKTILPYSSFENVDLSGARIEGAELMYNTFNNTVFHKVDIKDADLSYSSFERCEFTSTSIDDVYFDEATFNNTLFDYSAPLKKISEFEEINCTTQLADRMQFTKFNGFGVIFTKSLFCNILFDKADLRFATFDNVKFHNTQFMDSDLAGVTFRDVDLSNVEFGNVDLSGSNLTRAYGISTQTLSGTCGNKETRLPPGVIIKPCRKE